MCCINLHFADKIFNKLTKIKIQQNLCGKQQNLLFLRHMSKRQLSIVQGCVKYYNRLDSIFLIIALCEFLGFPDSCNLVVTKSLHKQFIQEQFSKWLKEEFSKQKGKFFGTKLWQRIPQVFHTALNQIMPPCALITSEMKSRDHCGLLSQRRSIQFSEVKNPITLLADKFNWAIVLKVHVTITERNRRESHFLQYCVEHHSDEIFSLETCSCFLCKIADGLKNGKRLEEDLWNQWYQFSTTIQPFEASQFKECDLVMWYYSYRGDSTMFFLGGDFPAVHTADFFYDAYKRFVTIEDVQFLNDLFNNRVCVFKTSWYKKNRVVFWEDHFVMEQKEKCELKSELAQFIRWLKRINVDYNLLTEEEKYSLKHTYEASQIPPGSLQYWIPFWPKNLKIHKIKKD